MTLLSNLTSIFVRYKKVLSYTVIILAALVSLTLKLYVSQVGYNPDIESWWLVKEAVVDGRSVYASTHRYNYGPIWSYILGIFGFFTENTGFESIQGLHYIVAAFLGFVDILMALVLFAFYGFFPAIVFLLNPVSILLSGYHSQFDNFAVLVGLLAFILYDQYTKQKEDFNRNVFFLASALIMGVSLSIKHILLFFPFWLFFLIKRTKADFIRYVAYLGITYGVFFGFFALEVLLHWSMHYNVWAGIKAFVFEYKGGYGNSAWVHILATFLPVDLIDGAFQWVPVFKGYMFIYVLSLLLSGLVFSRAKEAKKYLIFFYLIAFVALSPSSADQYLAIALPAIAVFFSNPIAITFNLISFAYLAYGGSANISGLIGFPQLVGIGERVFGLFPWDSKYKVFFLSGQGWLLLLLIYFTLYTFFAKRRINDVFRNTFSYLHFGLLTFCCFNLALLLYLKNFEDYGFSINVLRPNLSSEACSYRLHNYAGASCNGKRVCEFSSELKGCSGELKLKWTCSKKDLLYPVNFVFLPVIEEKVNVTLTCQNRFFY